MHHIQRHILRNLIKSETLRYSELKPHAVDPNLFMYHLKQLQKEHLVSKTLEGAYSLSSQGKLLADHTQFEDMSLRHHETPRLILLLAVYDDHKGWLLHTRSVQPVIGMRGFVHSNIELGQAVQETAKKRLSNLCSLDGNFKYCGSATIAIYAQNDLESYVHALILYCKNPHGILQQETPIGTNTWVRDLDFSDPAILPSMQELIQLINSGDLFFIERTYRLVLENVKV